MADYDDFITIGGQLLAKTGSGQYVLIPGPTLSFAEKAFESVVTGELTNMPEELMGRDRVYKKLIEGGGDIVNLKGMDQETVNAARAAARKLSPSSMPFHTQRGPLSDKIVKAWSKYLNRAKQILPAVAPWLSGGPIGAGISGLLYAGTSKPLNADEVMQRRNILNTPVTADNRDLHDQVGDASLRLMDRESGFDPVIESKLNNLRPEAAQRPISNYTAPDRGDWGPGLHLARGGIASLR